MKDEYKVNLKYVQRTHFAKGIFTGAVTSIAIGVWGLLLDRRARKRKEAKDLPTLEQLAEETEQSLQKALEEKKNLERGQEILKYGIPEAGKMVRFYGNHVLMYNQQTKTPIWVAEHMDKEKLRGSANRKHVKFKPDPNISVYFSAQNSDYWKSGWSRGHMAPAGDNKSSLDAMQDSFYLSNIVPQNYENNAGFWNRLEMYCRDLTKKYSNVYVISGPLMVPKQEEDGRKFVKYQVIGDNEVAVPTHLYKVIVVEDKKGRPAAIGSFVVPNEPIGFEHHLKEFEVPLQDLEHCVGVKLLPDLDTDKIKGLCRVDGCKLIGRKEFELYFIGRKLESANTLKRLDKVWGELKEKKLKPDRYLEELYAVRSVELSKKEEKLKSSS